MSTAYLKEGEVMKMGLFHKLFNALPFGVLDQHLNVQNVGKRIGVIGMATIFQVVVLISVMTVHPNKPN